MGQAQSEMEAPELQQQHSSAFSPTSLPSLSPNLMHSLVEEAAAFGCDENKSIDKQAQKALECPCIADLRSGPCGVPFSDAFLCFFKSTAEEKGSDCVHPFVALQNCIKANPNAFSKEILDGEEVKKEEEATQKRRIIPPIWSRESQNPKSKL